MVNADSTLDEVKAEFENTASYDVTGDISLCRRFIVAARILINRRPIQASQGGNSGQWSLGLINEQLKTAEAWLRDNGGMPAPANGRSGEGAGRVFSLENYRE